MQYLWYSQNAPQLKKEEVHLPNLFGSGSFNYLLPFIVTTFRTGLMRPLDAVALRTSRQSGDTKFILTAALSFIGFRSFTFGYTHCSHPFLIILFEQISQNRKSWVNGRLITRAFFVVEILSAGGAKPSTILTAEDFHRHRKEQSLLNVRQKVDGIPFKKVHSIIGFFPFGHFFRKIGKCF